MTSVQYFRAFVLSLIVLAFAAPRARAQTHLGNPLVPGVPTPRIGPIGGLNLNQQSGAYVSDCNCEFSTGSGMGFTVGAMGDMYLDRTFGLMGLATYNVRTVGGTRELRDGTYILDAATNALTLDTVPILQKSTVKLTYASVTPMFRYNGPLRMFLAAGPSLGLLIRSSIIVDGTILTPGYYFPDTQSPARSFQNSELDQPSRIRLDAVGMLGMEIALSERTFFAPGVVFDFPLTGIQNSNWKVSTFHITGAIQWRLR